MDKVLEFFEGDTLATSVWNNKYKIIGENTPADMHKRHIKEIAQKEFERLNDNPILSSQYDNLSKYGKKRFNYYHENFSTELLERITGNLENQISFDSVVLGGSPMQGIGNHKMYSSLSNCFFVGRPFDSYSGINRKEDEIAQLMKRRGGTGLDLSSIRPNGATVHNQASTSSGVVPFAEGYSAKTKQVAQYGRRGALMLSLVMQHPDSLEFIMSKQDRTKITGANISVIIPDDFMVAVEQNSDYLLRFPVDSNIENINLNDFEYNKLTEYTQKIIGLEEIENLEDILKNIPKYVKRIKAREYWETLILCAHTTAEPGILFLGNWEKGGTDWVYPQFRPVGTNPCHGGDMKILTIDGYKTFKELNGKTDIDFINKNGKVVKGKVWSNGIKPVYETKFTKTNFGDLTHIPLKTTKDHIFMLENGNECKISNSVKKRIKAFGKINSEITEYVKYGFIQGDGTYINGNTYICIGKDDADIAEIFNLKLDWNFQHENLKISKSSKSRFKIEQYNKILNELNFQTLNLPERSLPSTFNSWKDEDKLMFLKGLFSANGSIIISANRISFKTSCLKLSIEIKQILEYFGIKVTNTNNPEQETLFSNGIGHCKKSYNVTITERNSVLLFAEKIGFVHKYKQEALKQIINNRSPIVDSIKYIGDEEVFDFELFDDCHWGVVEGLISHNCFTGDMLLMTEDGEKSFAELAKKCEVEFKERGKFCLSLINRDNEIVPGRVWQTGIKRIINLQLDNGKVISCTPKHIFIANGEECEANDTLHKYLEGFEEDGYLVTGIIDNGECEVVYDFELKGIDENVKKNNICHWGIVQGVIAHNCSEIPMSEYDACRLLSRNLYTLVTNPFTQRAELLPEEDLYSAFYEQLIIADLLVDLELDYIDRIIEKISSGNDPEDLKQSEIEVWIKVKNKAKQGRRCGAGFTAFGDMLASLGLPYFSPDVTKKLFKIKLEAELDATIDMAILYGKFEGFDESLEKDSIFMNEVVLKEFPEQYQRMVLYGRRNVSWSTAAPVGSGSLMVQSTSGIEPLFEYCYERKKKCITKDDRVDVIDENDGCAYSIFYVLHPKFIKWAQIYFCDGSTMIETKNYLESLSKKELDELYEQSPWFGSSANDLNWKERVEIQSIVQRYTTHAISSTINLPEDCEVPLIGKIYNYSWKMGLKGNTVYREGSRGDGIMSSTKDKKSVEIDDDFIPNFAPKRPKILPAHYHTIKYKNKTYSIIIGFYKERPYEVFIISGVQNLPEVFDETTDFIKGEIIKDFKDWYNFESETFTVKEITDVEGDEKMISLMLSGLLRHRTPMKYVIKIMEKIKPIAGSFTHRLIKVLSHYLEIDAHDNSEKCPECGGKLRHENGCVICENGHSKC